MTDNLQKNIILPENISDEYEVISCIKSGEFSSAYVLYDKMCQRKVFMKIGNTDVIENEARMLAHLEVNGVPEVYRCFGSGDRSYLIRQYINGKTLREHINASGAFPVRKALEICISVCEILSELHKKNPPVIHRDIKSDNIIITPEGEVFIVDFGIAREYDGNAERDTQVMGTPVTAPPEQFGYRQTDQRSDVYSVGVLLNELVTGSTKIALSEMPRRPAAVVNRCTQFEPAKRFESAAECGKALQKIYKKQPLKKAAACLLCVLCVAALTVIHIHGGDNSENLVTSKEDLSASQNDFAFTGDIQRNEEVQKILLDSEYTGDWEYGGKIPKKKLEEFGGDVEIKLELEIVRFGTSGDFQVIAPLNNGNDTWEHIFLESDIPHKPGEAWIDLDDDDNYCTFVISREDIEALSGDYLEFQVYNVIVKSAELKKLDDNKTPVEVELDSSYPGDYALSKTISLDVLKRYSGDVKIVLEIEVDERYDYANFIPIAITKENNDWVNLITEISCYNVRNYDGFIEVEPNQTECTLILSEEAVNIEKYDKIGFQAINVTIKSAKISGADVSL